MVVVFAVVAVARGPATAGALTLAVAGGGGGGAGGAGGARGAGGAGGAGGVGAGVGVAGVAGLAGVAGVAGEGGELGEVVTVKQRSGYQHQVDRGIFIAERTGKQSRRSKGKLIEDPER